MAKQRENDFCGGCPLGSLASELAENDSDARQELAVSYHRWQGAIQAGLTAMQSRGELSPDADPSRLAKALLSALQGGLLLGKTLRDSAPLEAALTTVIDHIASLANAIPTWPSPPRSPGRPLPVVFGDKEGRG